MSVSASLLNSVFLAVLLALTVGQSSSLQNGTSGGWPSLHFRFSIKRSAMEVHGQSDFSVLANPILSTNDDTSVLYNTFAAFAEDEMLYKYSFVDGVAYISRSLLNGSDSKPLVHCVDADTFPPINSLVAELSEVTAVATISTSNGTVIPCLSGNSFKVSVSDIEFGLCFSGSSGFTLFGNDMDIKVEYVENHMPILAPKLDDSANDECETRAEPVSVTPIGKSLLTGEQIPIDEARDLEPRFDFSFKEDSCSCQSTPRPCIFIHGLGVLEEEEENLDAYKYWGNVTGHTPCCSSVKYAVMNTVNNSWTDDLQQEKVCDHMLEVSETSQGGTIEDTIIVSHSMGGLMVAGAIANERCRLANSTTWVSIGSPMTGSMASDYFQESCKDQTNIFMENFAEKTGFCPADDGIKSLAYMHERYSTPELNEAYWAAQKAYRDNVYALMCSNSFAGIISSYQYGFWIMGAVIPHKSRKNDGMVEFHSCAGGFPASQFGNDHHDRFYVTKLNHYDVAFKSGDALLDKRKMPLKWFECLL